MKFSLHGVKDIGDVLDVDDVPMRIEHFEEAAHVRALEFLRQIHEKANGRDCILQGMGFVANLNGKSQPSHAHLVDAQLAVIALALLIVQ